LQERAGLRCSCGRASVLRALPIFEADGLAQLHAVVAQLGVVPRELALTSDSASAMAFSFFCAASSARFCVFCSSATSRNVTIVGTSGDISPSCLRTPSGRLAASVRPRW
jgi:hypothetical protein